MKAFVVSVALALGVTGWATPGMSHHNSPNSTAIEEVMPEDALDQHNAAVDSVLDRLDEMGISSMAGSTVSNDMDPADAAQGNTCSVLVDDVCESGPGNTDMSGYGMTRSPPEPVNVP